ncbi:hypothetical protein [Sphingobacterium multivorum]|uniref:hypothetical protein n=1 Tax=Sphingobacterium multivorum TaxID=28454 RepID=UPI003DA413E2
MEKKQVTRKKSPNSLPRAKSAKEMQDMVFKTWKFSGEWEKHLGNPEPKGLWLIWGGSFNGKSTYVMRLCKYLTGFGKVLFDDLEEGWCTNTQAATHEAGLDDVGSLFHFLNKEPIPVLIERLKKHKSAKIVVLNSLQYTELTFKSYLDMENMFPNKLFIIISHAEGKEPEGKVGVRLKHHASKKIRIEGFRAFAQVRGKGSNYMDIWKEGAEEYWNELK